MSIYGNQVSAQSFESGMRPSAMNQHCKDSLLEVIESQIIPRLIDALPNDKPLGAIQTSAVFDPEPSELEAFARLCVLESPREVSAYTDRLVLENIPSEALFAKLIAPAARELGWMWEQDIVDFSQVTLGLVRLQQLTHRLGYEYQSGPQIAGPTRRMMIACAPGSQHILGLVMVSELFRKAGWHVVVEITPTVEGLYQAVRNEWFDLVGLSVGLTEQLPTLPSLIAGLKAASRKPQVPVILGGAAFMSATVSQQSLGADGVTNDGLEAVAMAVDLLAVD
jgi:methanogenic corrinoid protein MtbC1